MADVVGIDSQNVTLYDEAGNEIGIAGAPVVVTISGSVEVANDTGNPLPVSIQNYPATQPVSGTVALDAASLAALEQTTVSGTVAVSNFPTTTEISNDAGSPIPVSGTFFPATQSVSGTVALDAASLAALESISVQNFPATQAVSGTVALDTASLAALEQTTVTVANFPATQATDVTDRAGRILGTVEVANDVGNPLPVSGTFFPATQPVSGTVALDAASLAALEVTTADVSDRGARLLGGVRLGSDAQRAAGIEATAFPGQNSLRTTSEPSQLFADFFDVSTLDPNRWTSGGTVPPSTNGGTFLSLEPGTTANATSFIDSVPKFVASSDAYTRLIMTMALGDVIIPGNYRFIGLGSGPASPTVSNAVTNGAGFEIRVDGTMWAVIYANSVRIFEQQITRPLDTNWHRVAVQTKTSGTLFYFDNSNVPVVTASLVAPGVQNQPIRIVSINGASALAAAPMLRIGVVTVGDTGRNNTALSDGTYGWRKAQVSAQGALAVSIRTDTSNPPAYLALATTANTTLIPSPGPGLSIYVTDMEGSNAGAAMTTATFYEGPGTTARYARVMAASGGGFLTNLGTPWKLPADTALTVTQSVASASHFTFNYYVAV